MKFMRNNKTIFFALYGLIAGACVALFVTKVLTPLIVQDERMDTNFNIGENIVDLQFAHCPFLKSSSRCYASEIYFSVKHKGRTFDEDVFCQEVKKINSDGVVNNICEDNL